MKLQKFRHRFGRVVTAVSYIALALLFAMVFIVAIDVILRKSGIGSIRGSNELTSFLMVPVCMLGIPVLQLKNGHVWVSLFVDKFPYRFRNFWCATIMAIETVVIALLAYGANDRLVSLYTRTRVSDILELPWWVFAIFVLIAFVELFILSLIDTIQFYIDGVKNEKPEAKTASWSEDEVKGI